MIHICMQIENRDDVVKALEPLGIKSAIDFNSEEPGIYLMSRDPLTFNTLEDYTTEELIKELEDRGEQFYDN